MTDFCPTDRQLAKSISRINNATDEVQLAGSIYQWLDAEQTVDFLLWDTWSHASAEYEFHVHYEDSLNRTFRNGLTQWHFLLDNGKKMTLETNKNYWLVNAYIR